MLRKVILSVLLFAFAIFLVTINYGYAPKELCPVGGVEPNCNNSPPCLTCQDPAVAYCNVQKGDSCNTSVTSGRNYSANACSIYMTVPARGNSIDPGTLITIDYRVFCDTAPSSNIFANLTCSGIINGARTQFDFKSVKLRVESGQSDTQTYRFYCYAQPWVNISSYGINLTFQDNAIGGSWASLYNEYNKSSLNVSLIFVNNDTFLPSDSSSNSTIILENQIWYGKGTLPRTYLGSVETRNFKNSNFSSTDWWTSNSTVPSGSRGVLIASANATCTQVSGQINTCVDGTTVFTQRHYNISTNNSHMIHLNLTPQKTYAINVTYAVYYQRDCNGSRCPPKINVSFSNVTNPALGSQVIDVTGNGSFVVSIRNDNPQNLTSNITITSVPATYSSTLCTTAMTVSECRQNSVEVYITNVSIENPELKIIENTSDVIDLSSISKNVTYYIKNATNLTEVSLSPVYMNNTGHFNVSYTFPYRTQAGKWSVNVSVVANSSVRQENATTNGIFGIIPIINETKFLFFRGGSVVEGLVTDLLGLNRINRGRNFHVNATIFNNPADLVLTGVFSFNGTDFNFASCRTNCSTYGKATTFRSTRDPIVTSDSAAQKDTPSVSNNEERDYWTPGRSSFTEDASFNATVDNGYADPNALTSVKLTNKFDQIEDLQSCPSALCRISRSTSVNVYGYNSSGHLIYSETIADAPNIGGSVLAVAENSSFRFFNDPRIYKYVINGTASARCRGLSDDSQPDYCLGSRHLEVSRTVYQTNLSLGTEGIITGRTDFRYNASNSTTNSTIVYYGEISYGTNGTELGNSSRSDSYYTGDSSQSTVNVSLLYPNESIVLKNIETLNDLGFFNGTFALPYGLDDGNYKIRVEYANHKNQSGDSLNETRDVEIITPPLVSGKSNESGIYPVIVNISTPDYFGYTGDGSSISSPSINVSDLYILNSISNSTFNRGEELVFNANISNIRGEELVLTELNFSLINASSGILARESGVTSTEGKVNFSSYTFLPSDSLGNYTVKINDTDGNYVEHNITLNDTIRIHKFFVNNKSYSENQDTLYFVGENITPMYSWLELRNVRDELSGLFDGAVLNVTILSPYGGSVIKSFSSTYKRENSGNYTLFVDYDNYNYSTGNVTVSLNIYDSNNNTNVLIANQTSVPSLSKNLITTFVATNLTTNKTRVLRTQEVSVGLKAYDSWIDMSADDILNASHGLMSGQSCSFNLKMFNDTRLYESDYYAEVDTNLTTTTGENTTSILIAENATLGAKDIKAYSSCQGGIDGISWNNITGRNSGSNDSVGLFIVDDLNPHSIRFENSTADDIYVYERNQTAYVRANFTYALDSSVAISETYKNLTMNISNSSGLITNISGYSQFGTGTDSNGNVTFNFTIGSAVAAGAYNVTIATLYGTIDKTFYVSEPVSYQFASLNTSANASAYYQKNITLSNTIGGTRTFVVKNHCPSGSSNLSSSEISVGGLSGRDDFYCSDKNQTVSIGFPATTTFIFKKSDVIYYNRTNWTTNESATHTEDLQYVYANVTFTNNDSMVSFSGVLRNIVAPPGTNITCSGCNTTISMPPGNVTTFVVQASGNFTTVTEGSDGSGGKGPSGTWEQDTSQTSTTSIQYARQLVTAQLREAVTGPFDITWSVGNRQFDEGTCTDFQCTNCDGILRAPVDGSENTTHANSSANCITNNVGSETKLSEGTVDCSYRYKKQVTYVNNDPQISYSTLLSNISVTKRLNSSNPTLLCGTNSTNLITELSDGTNSSNFIINTLGTTISSSTLNCTLNWDYPAVKPIIDRVSFNLSVIGSNQNVKVNLSISDSDSDTNLINTSISLTPAELVSGVDDIFLCSNTSSVIECSFNPSSSTHRDIEKRYNVVAKSVDDARCRDERRSSDSIWVDTRAPRILSVSSDKVRPALNQNVTVNISLEDLNLSEVIISYLPNATVNASYINETIATFTNGVAQNVTNYTFDLSRMNQTLNTTNGTRVRYFIYAKDKAGNIRKSNENSFFIPCLGNHRELEIRARPVSVINGQGVTSGTATVRILDAETGIEQGVTSTAIHKEEDGGLTSSFCKDRDSFLIPGKAYKAIIQIKTPTSTSYHVEEFIAPPL